MPIPHAAKQLLRNQCFVNGHWVSADSGEALTVRDPATHIPIIDVPNLGKPDIARAIEAAQAAQKSWQTTTSQERSELLRAWYQLIMEHQKSLAAIMTSEQGKPFAESMGEIAYAASYIEWYAEEAKRQYGETIPGPSSDTRLVVTREPVGVCAAITPWNFPAAMITRKVAPALAAGCTMLVKPASETPLTALALAVLANQAGFPPGVLNVLTGQAKTIGAVLTESPTVRKLSFTGSTPIGAKLMAQSAPTIKRVSLELGGNAPFIVFDDADIPAAVQGLIASKFRNAGQTCVCANRVYVQRPVYDEFVTALKEEVAALTVGNGFDEGVAIGPLINQAAVEKVQHHVEDALSLGAELVLGGKPHALGGHWFQPTILGNVSQQSLCAREETFGPVAPLFVFDTEAQAIDLANDTEFGLAAYFYAQNVHRIRRVAEGLETGMVGINTGLISNAAAPFGGVKQSGIGREGSHHGLAEYTELKYMCFGGE